MTRIAYLGPAGTFTEQAALQWAATVDDGQTLPTSTVPAALEALRSGAVDAAVVPFENSVEGSVPATLQALLDGAGDGLRICAEVLVEVQFNVLTRSGVTLTDLTGPVSVATHPHAAAQTRAWMATNLPEAEVVLESSTARAAQAVAEGRYDAAISAPGAGPAYGLDSAAEHIADREGAVTRFVVLRKGAPTPEPSGADRTTLVVWIWANRPGALLGLLHQFAVRGIDLSRLESRPTGEALGEYCFWIDADAHLDEPRLREALIGLRRTSRAISFLGSYPRADGHRALVPTDAREDAYQAAQAWLDSLTHDGSA
ncbi:prephenate dehydratase [Ornithinimicrobium panacihumi]|uniref:prephenate dehydratase n=1 Tax=Ornithinimicrobium panacihumi TaxID=2008449 RepID=UPI003F8BCF25